MLLTTSMHLAFKIAMQSCIKCAFESQCDREKRERYILCLWVHSANGCNSHEWASPVALAGMLVLEVE